MSDSKMVYQAIANVAAAIAVNGIAKQRKNQQQGYSFRGIDDVYNALSPMLAEHKLCILPRMISRSKEERATQKGGVLFYVTVEAEFDFVSAVDGSSHTIKTYGEAMDSGDKATNKAMSAAYKYACMQTFCIPTEGDNDSDARTHVVLPKTQDAPNYESENAEPMVMEESAIADFCAAMEGAATVIELQKHFAAAIVACATAKDMDARDRFVDVKDKRKAELSGGKK